MATPRSYLHNPVHGGHWPVGMSPAPAWTRPRAGLTSIAQTADAAAAAAAATVAVAKKPKLGMPDEYLPPNNILFIQNLPDGTTQEDLREVFEAYVSSSRDSRPWVLWREGREAVKGRRGDLAARAAGLTDLQLPGPRRDPNHPREKGYRVHRVHGRADGDRRQRGAAQLQD